MDKNNKIPEVRFKGFTEDWKLKTLGSLFEITSASRVLKNEWTESGVPFFRSSDVVSDYKKTDNIKAFISLELYKKLSTISGCVQKNDILVTGGGSIGIPYLVKTNEPLYFKDADLLWLKSANKVSGYFLYTFFSTTVFRNYVNSITHIGTISHYTIEQAKSTPIIIPKLTEQKQIGSFFQNLDNLIALHQKKYDKLVILKKAMLVKMFPKKGSLVPEIRFKGFSGEWEEKELGNLCKIAKSGGTPTSTNKEYYDGNIPFLAISDMTSQGKYLTKTRKSISQKGIEDSASWLVPENSIIYSMYASVGFVSINKIPIATSQAVINLILKDEIDVEYIYYYLSLYQQYIHEFIETGTQGNLNAQTVNLLNVFLPIIDEQKKIGKYFESLDNQIALHKTQLDKLNSIKKACFSKMFVAQD